MKIDLQPTHLKNELVNLSPLKPEDFEKLYEVASDPSIWEQHPNKDRFKREVFEVFFEGAIKSGGAFLICDTRLKKVIGSSRFYECDPNTIAIGYTFLARSHWGSVYNQNVKKLMITYAFAHYSKINFHVGANNIRSQKAIQKTGAKKIGEHEMEYYGESKKLNFIYEITKSDFESEKKDDNSL